tara:strand:- start:936 stop:1655 length:720 start_codon:yes stop_codon:yes gene_type:complete
MVLGVIPARLNSTRFPKKILAPLVGKPMIAHVVERTLMSKKLDKVILAIDSLETKEALKGFNFDIMMTSENHLSGTDRIAEVTRTEKNADIIINIQGDEPLVDFKIIDNLIESFNDINVNMSTVISKSLSIDDLIDPNVVKTIIDERFNAVNFKRKVLDMDIGGLYKHIGMYAYRRKTLFHFSDLPISESEKVTKLEQMRAIDNGILIKTILTNSLQLSVDTKEDLNNVKEIIRSKSEL